MMIVCDKNRYFRKALLPVLRLLSLSDVVVCRSRGKDTLKSMMSLNVKVRAQTQKKSVQSLDAVETFFIFMMP